MTAIDEPGQPPVGAAPAADANALEQIWADANGHAGAGRIPEAIALYQQLAAALPDVADIWCNMGAMLDAGGQRTAAIASLRQAVTVDPMHDLAHCNLAGMLEAEGDLEGAVAHYQEAVYINPNRLDAVRGLGCALNLSGRPEQARETLRDALKIAPQDAATHFYLGNVFATLEEPVLARHHLRTAYKLSGDPRVGNNLANLALAMQQPEEAENLLREVTAAHPDYAPAWNSLGGALLTQQRLAEARAALERSLAIDPEFTAARHGLARCLFKMSDLEGALASFQAIIDREPTNIAARVDIYRALQHLGRFADAEPWQRKVLELRPEDAQAWCDLAATLKRLDRRDEAGAAIERALFLKPEFASALVITAELRALKGDHHGGVEAAQKALEHANGDVDVMNAVGGLFESWRSEELAIITYRQVKKLHPDNAHAAARLFDLALSVCDWTTYEADCQTQIAAVETAVAGGSGGRGIDVFNLQALPVDYAFVARAARHAAAEMAREAREHAPATAFAPRAKRRERIRLGYALAYTHFHSLPLVLKEVIERHDRDRFELFGYSLNKCDATPFSQSYRAAFDHFTDVPESAPYGAAERIQRDDLDVLIDVTGLTGQTCMPFMSFRPAPLQIHAFGYSITTGADYIDYLITDRRYIPPEWADLGTEKLIYMPDTFMPAARPSVSEVRTTRAAHDLPEDSIVFCNFNHPCKFEPRIFGAWMEILRAVPDSVLWLGSWLRNTQRNLIREAEARGVEGRRLRFANIVNHHEHLQRLPLADIALDNFYHGGGVTTLDVLWAGVPLLSLPGIAPGGRLGATLSHAVGMPELVCADLDDYKARAIALAEDPDARQTIRATLLRQRLEAPLFDTDRFTRNLERGIAAAWDNHLAGNAPRQIDLGVG